MIEIRDIYYKRKKYRCRYVDLESGCFLVGPESLENVLMNEDKDNYKDEEARVIDEMIFCYVPDEMFKNADNDKLKDYIEKEIL